MTGAIQAKDWLHFIDREYLASFIPEGGSAIKFAVPEDESLRDDLMDGLCAIAERSGFFIVRINAAETKVNMVDEIFFRTAQQVPWRILSQKILAKLADESGYAWIDGEEEPLYLRLAGHNRVDPQLLLLDLKKAVANKVFNRRDLSRDFRVAMTHLCLAELSGGADGLMTTSILIDWLTGRNKAVSAVKSFNIFRKINRHSARYCFESMLHWIKFSGYSGTALVLDVQRVMVTKKKNARDQSIFYSKAGVLDSYEVLRQFIDSADRLEACFIAVVPALSFLEDRDRGIGVYEALKFRIFDEVRDRRLVNPMASLARIAIAAEGASLDGNRD